MLRFLLLLVVILSALCGLAVVSAKLAAQNRLILEAWPFPLNTVNTAGCQLPCWHGIRPGITTFEDAEKIIDSDPMYDRVSSPRMIELDNSSEWRLHATPTEYNTVVLDYSSEDKNGDQRRVMAIHLYGNPTPGHIVAALGSPPHAIIAGLCFGQSALFYDEYVVYVITDTKDSYFDPLPFLPESPAKMFLYLTPPDPLRRPSNPDVWRGFRAKPLLNATDIGCD